MNIHSEIILLAVLLSLVAASLIVKLFLRSKLKSIDGFSGLIRQSQCSGNIIGTAGDQSTGTKKQR